jgi:hypothetical protein
MKLLALSSLVVLTFAASAMASPFVLPAGVPLYFQYNNLEQVSLTNNIVVPGSYAPAAGTQGNWGVLNVSDIQLGAVSIPNTDIGGGPVIFSDTVGATQGEITGIFYGIQVLPGGQTATGGTLDLFWHAPGTDIISANCLAGHVTGVGACGPNAATVAEFTSGTFLARLNFTPGIITGNTTITLESNTVPTDSGTGQAEGFANVDLTDVGPWTAALNGNYFHLGVNGDADARFGTFYNGLPSWDGGCTGTGVHRVCSIVGLRSNDPARDFTASVPEPGTLALLGLGLLGLGLVSRRKLVGTFKA